MGELMRRYWQPCAVSATLKSDHPQKSAATGRGSDPVPRQAGPPGLVHEHCCHRGTSLFYGRIEDDGIRCCYHGWKFDVKGHCLEQPAEVDGGRNRDKIASALVSGAGTLRPGLRLYGPAREEAGAAALGASRRPRTRRIHRDRLRKPPYGPLNDLPFNPLQFNWLQTFENTMDPAHVPWLHFRHSGDQFTGSPLMRMDGERRQPPPYALIENLPRRSSAGGPSWA